MVERARVVIGADGRNSRVAKAVRPEQYNEKPMLQWSYYTYWSGLPVDGFEITIRPDRGFGALPDERRADAARRRLAVRRVGGLQDRRRGELPQDARARARVRRARPGRHREERFAGGAVPNFFRKPYGPGWALVGDAGYTKDPITAQGISDAFRDAELCSTALDEFFSGRCSFDDAMVDYQRTRDTGALPIYDFTTQLATLEAPPLEMQQLLGAVYGNQDAMDAFVSITAGTVSPIEFFDPEHIGRIMGAAAMLRGEGGLLQAGSAGTAR